MPRNSARLADKQIILPPDTTSKRASQKPTLEKKSDGHYIIVNGRRWRATDPLIPDAVLAELKHYLAKGRSGVRAKGGIGREDDEHVKLARARTGLAKLGLGERGKPEWWNTTDEDRKARWERALHELRQLDNT